MLEILGNREKVSAPTLDSHPPSSLMPLQLPDTEDQADHHQPQEPETLPHVTHSGADPGLQGTPGSFPLQTDSARVPASCLLVAPRRSPGATEATAA